MADQMGDKWADMMDCSTELGSAVQSVEMMVDKKAALRAVSLVDQMVPCLAASTADLMVEKLVDRMDTSTVLQLAELKDQTMADKMAALRVDSKVYEMAD
jgi:hypothetical protein